MFDALKACPLRLARSQGVPPDDIFHDATLPELCETLPTKVEEMAEISGIGAAKLKRYGKIFLDVIQNHILG